MYLVVKEVEKVQWVINYFNKYGKDIIIYDLDDLHNEYNNLDNPKISYQEYINKWHENNNKCDNLYKNRGYLIMDFENIYNDVCNILDKIIMIN